MSENALNVVRGPSLVLVRPDPVEDVGEPEVVYEPSGGCFQPADVVWKVEIKQEDDPDIIIPVIKTEPVEPADWWEGIPEQVEEVEQKVVPKKELEDEENTTIQAPEGFRLKPDATICPICKRRFRYFTHLKDHVLHSHKSPALFSCDHCDKQFRRKYSLEKHVAEEHSDLVVKKENCGDPDIKVEVDQHECEDHDGEEGEAGETNGIEDEVEAETENVPPPKQTPPRRKMSATHVKAREQKRQKGAIEIAACDKQSNAMKTRQGKEVKASSPQDPSSPTKRKSPKSSVTSGQGQAKTPTQLEEDHSKEFQCSTCHKKFSSAYCLKQHALVHSEERPWSCNTCGKTFRRKGALKDHQRVHSNVKKFSCTICQKSFRSNSNLRSHIRSHTDNFPFFCTHCSKRFRQNCHLKAHLITHTNEKVHTCKFCGKPFARLGGLKAHIRTHTLEKPYKCTQCPKAFSNKSTMINHLKSHSDVRAYKCRQCEKTFKTQPSLRSHVRYTHDKLRKHECNVCNKRFHSNLDLTRHSKVHTNRETYSCSTCGLVFKFKIHLNLHLKGKRHLSKLK